MRPRLSLKLLGIVLLAAFAFAAAHAQTRATLPAGRSQTALDGVHPQLQSLDTRIRNVWVKLGLAKPAPVTPPVPQPASVQEATAQLDQIERRVARAEAEVKSQTKGASCSVDKFIDPVHNATWSCWPYRCQPGPPARCPESCKAASDCVLGFGCVSGGCVSYSK
jgi:hypothetical protein